MSSWASFAKLALSAIVKAMIALFSYKAGYKKKENEVIQGNAEVKEKQEDIAVNGTDSVERLRKGDF